MGKDTPLGGKARVGGLEPSSTVATLQPHGSGVGRGSPWGAARGLEGYGGYPAEDGSPSQ